MLLRFCAEAGLFYRKIVKIMGEKAAVLYEVSYFSDALTNE